MPTRAGERVCLETRKHGVVLAVPLAKAIVLAGGGGVLLARPFPLSVVGALALAAAAVVAVRAVWRWEHSRVVVTTRRLVVVDGALRRRTRAIALDRLGAVAVEQTLAGRLLGYGTMVASDLEVAYVPEPRRVYGLVERLCA